MCQVNGQQLRLYNSLGRLTEDFTPSAAVVGLYTCGPTVYSYVHLGNLRSSVFPDTLRRLYIARDDDPAGDGAMATLVDRAQEVGIEAVVISPRLGDFNEDLRLLGIDALRAASRVQIAAQDVARFMELAA